MKIIDWIISRAEGMSYGAEFMYFTLIYGIFSLILGAILAVIIVKLIGLGG